jgi:hypothetical protein
MFYISEWWKHITIIIWWFAGALKRENASTIEDDDKEGSVNNGWFAGAFACLFLPMQRTGICASIEKEWMVFCEDVFPNMNNKRY